MENSEVIACFPGDRICATNENTVAGSGTYERSGYIYASLAGIVETKAQDKVGEAKLTCGTKSKFFFLEPPHPSDNQRQPALCEMFDHLRR
jgi:exosome complex RNA-binding protein Csl4